MLVDSNPAFVKGLQESINREPGLEVIAVAYNGSDALKTALRTQPDVLVTGLILPELDGFALLESLAKAKLKTRIIVLTELPQSSFVRQAMGMGACYYMLKPVDPAILCSRVRESNEYSESETLLSPDFNQKDAIQPLLMAFSIPPGTAGYQYLHFAISMASRMEILSGRITTELYPAVARAFQTDQRNVERAI